LFLFYLYSNEISVRTTEQNSGQEMGFFLFVIIYSIYWSSQKKKKQTWQGQIDNATDKSSCNYILKCINRIPKYLTPYVLIWHIVFSLVKVDSLKQFLSLSVVPNWCLCRLSVVPNRCLCWLNVVSERWERGCFYILQYYGASLVLLAVLLQLGACSLHVSQCYLLSFSLGAEYHLTKANIQLF